MKRPLHLAALLVLVSYASDAWIVRDDGVGPVRVGMTLAQVKATLRQGGAQEESSSDTCFYVHVPSHPHLAFMIEDGRLSRVDVDARGIATSAGIQVGDSEARAPDLWL